MSGETECVEKALMEHQSSLVRFAHSLLKNLEAARDAVQEAYFEMIRRQCCCELRSPRAWLYRVCRHKAYRRMKRDGRFVVLEQPEDLSAPGEAGDSGLSKLMADEQRQDLRQRVEALPKRQREVIRLHYFEGLTLAEVAEALEDKANNIYQLHHAGLAGLRRLSRHGELRESAAGES